MKKKVLYLPNKPLSNIELLKYAKILNLHNFRGIYSRNALPSTGPYKNESAIINLDDKNGLGSHWVCYKKKGQKFWYFDSFGDLRPFKELFNYLKVKEILYNYNRYQTFNTVICGHLCLNFLYKKNLIK